MNKHLHKKVIEIPLYRGLLVIILSNSKKKVRKVMPEFGKEHLFAHAFAVNWKGMQGYVAVLNFEHKHKGISAGVIAHEALHLTNYILGDRGVVADFDNDEASAYLLEWITDTIHNFAKKKGFKV